MLPIRASFRSYPVDIVERVRQRCGEYGFR
jgi:hypothetical protein